MNKITEEILMIAKDLHMTHTDLILETELVENEESYLHPQLIGCSAEELRRAEKFHYAFIWQDIVRIYENTRGLAPQITVDEILKQYSLEDVIYTFAVISAIKKHDGRIYGDNRKFMDSISIDPVYAKMTAENLMKGCGLDEIHTAHINQLITELRKRSEK